MADLWQCPKCGRRFARAGQKHVCQRVTVEEHLDGRPRRVVALFRAFERLVAACGPFFHDPIKAQIGFQGTARIFAGVRLQDNGLAGYLDLARRVDDSRFTRVGPYTKHLFVHHFRITSPDQLDDRFAAYVRAAYAVGNGARFGGTA